MATKNPYQGDDKDFFAAARGEDGGIKKEAPKAAKPTAKKAPVVTKEQMQKAGFDNLRDYMNAKKGLTRRGEKKPPQTPSLSVSAQRDLDMTESRRAGQENMKAIRASRARKDELRASGPFKEGGKVKKYAKGGGIELRGKTKCKIV